MAAYPLQTSAHLDVAPPFLDTLLRFEAAHRRRLTEQMRSCFHDEALIESVASGGAALGPDETIEAIRLAYADGVYEIGDWRYEEITPDIILSSTGAKHRLPHQQMRDETVCRLMIGKDGLMWHVRLFNDRAQALAYLEQHQRHLELQNPSPAQRSTMPLRSSQPKGSTHKDQGEVPS